MPHGSVLTDTGNSKRCHFKAFRADAHDLESACLAWSNMVTYSTQGAASSLYVGLPLLGTLLPAPHMLHTLPCWLTGPAGHPAAACTRQDRMHPA